MADPRNIAHDKKVIQEKKNQGEDPADGAVVDTVQPGLKPPMEHPQEHEDPASERAHEAEDEAAADEEKAD